MINDPTLTWTEPKLTRLHEQAKHESNQQNLGQPNIQNPSRHAKLAIMPTSHAKGEISKISYVMIEDRSQQLFWRYMWDMMS